MMNSNSRLSLTSIGVCFDIMILCSVIHLLWEYFNMQWRVCSQGFRESLFDILITNVSDEDPFAQFTDGFTKIGISWTESEKREVSRIMVTSISYLCHKIDSQTSHPILNSYSQLPYSKRSN